MNKRKRRSPTLAVSYLRTHRRNWGLTQEELASLIGTVSAKQISLYENGKRDFKLEVALACQVLFGVPPSIMFRDSYALVEEEVIRNIYREDQALENSINLSDLRKRELFSMALQRAIRRPHRHQLA